MARFSDVSNAWMRATRNVDLLILSLFNSEGTDDGGLEVFDRESGYEIGGQGYCETFRWRTEIFDRGWLQRRRKCDRLGMLRMTGSSDISAVRGGRGWGSGCFISMPEISQVLGSNFRNV